MALLLKRALIHQGGRAGRIIILHAFLEIKKRSIFRSRYAFSIIVVACETRLTENGIPPEPYLCWCRLNILD